MFTIKPGKRKFNQPTKTPGHLDKQGRVYKNNLLDTDLTSQQPTKRKLKG